MARSVLKKIASLVTLKLEDIQEADHKTATVREDHQLVENNAVMVPTVPERTLVATFTTVQLTMNVQHHHQESKVVQDHHRVRKQRLEPCRNLLVTLRKSKNLDKRCASRAINAKTQSADMPMIQMLVQDSHQKNHVSRAELALTKSAHTAMMLKLHNSIPDHQESKIHASADQIATDKTAHTVTIQMLPQFK